MPEASRLLLPELFTFWAGRVAHCRTNSLRMSAVTCLPPPGFYLAPLRLLPAQRDEYLLLMQPTLYEFVILVGPAKPATPIIEPPWPPPPPAPWALAGQTIAQARTSVANPAAPTVLAKFRVICALSLRMLKGSDSGAVMALIAFSPLLVCISSRFNRSPSHAQNAKIELPAPNAL